MNYAFKKNKSMKKSIIHANKNYQFLKFIVML